MSQRITAGQLFEQMRERLGLTWAAGTASAERVIVAGDTNARRPSLAGYLNIIYPNKVQILGTEELTWLDGLDARARWEVIEKIMQARPLALVISKGGGSLRKVRRSATSHFQSLLACSGVSP